MNVVTLGSFDLFHRGHVRLLKRCRLLAQENAGGVVVGLNTDGFIELYKGRPPVLSFKERRAVLRACRYVDAVIPNAQRDGTAVETIEASAAGIIVVGSDWQDRDYLGQLGISEGWLAAKGIEIRYVSYTAGISSTAIRERIA